MGNERSHDGADPYDMAGATSRAGTTVADLARTDLSADEEAAYRQAVGSDDPPPDDDGPQLRGARSASALPCLEPLVPARIPAAFPVDALPSTLRTYVRALATATQTPADMAGMCVLGTLAACAGGRALVEARAGWREPVNLYGLVVMPPASRKSAVIAEATRPLYEVEAELMTKVEGAIVEAETRRDVANKAADKARRAAANGPAAKRDSLTSDAVSATTAAASVTVPVRPRLVADDATPEAAQSLLSEHGGRIAFISAEGGLFDIMAGRYSDRAPSLDVWLKGHAGDPMRVDRKGRPSEKIDRPALTLLLTVQPSVLDGIARNGQFRGRGLTARFLYAVPTSNVGHRLVGAPPIPAEVANAYADTITTLARDLVEWTDPAVLPLTPDAANLMLDIERRIEPQLAPDGALGHIAEWGGKLAGAVLRLAGLLHLADDPHAIRQPISADTLARADQIGEYFAEHASAALSRLGEATQTSAAAHIVDHLVRHDMREFTVRGLHSSLSRGRFPTVASVIEALDVLEDHGWVIRQPGPPHKGPGRKPSPSYQLHPDAPSTEPTQYTEPGR